MEFDELHAIPQNCPCLFGMGQEMNDDYVLLSNSMYKYFQNDYIQ